MLAVGTSSGQSVQSYDDFETSSYIRETALTGYFSTSETGNDELGDFRLTESTSTAAAYADRALEYGGDDQGGGATDAPDLQPDGAGEGMPASGQVGESGT